MAEVYASESFTSTFYKKLLLDVKVSMELKKKHKSLLLNLLTQKLFLEKNWKLTKEDGGKCIRRSLEDKLKC